MKYPYYSRAAIRAAMQSRGAAPRKRLGQNYLIEPAIVERMAASIAERVENLKTSPFRDSNDTRPGVLEIGPGLGVLTWHLLLSSIPVTAIEIDPVAVHLLQELLLPAFPDSPPQLIRADALPLLEQWRHTRTINLDGISLPRPHYVCGNLPYYISTDLLLAVARLPAIVGGVFLLQQEFAERIVSPEAISSLGVFLGNLGRWQSLMRVRATCFYPQPTVDSTVIAFEAHPEGPRCSPIILERVLRLSFAARRKKLINAWQIGLKARGSGTNDVSLPVEDWNITTLQSAAREIGLDERLRAEAVEPGKYYQLANCLEHTIGSGDPVS
ncbi:MAG: hypothetical protein KDK30_07360 [Leptospiraceae bacterium]|nr:hypothetical protein [Leptospiraceae bacterium]